MGFVVVVALWALALLVAAPAHALFPAFGASTSSTKGCEGRNARTWNLSAQQIKSLVRNPPGQVLLRGPQGEIRILVHSTRANRTFDFDDQKRVEQNVQLDFSSPLQLCSVSATDSLGRSFTVPVQTIAGVSRDSASYPGLAAILFPLADSTPVRVRVRYADALLSDLAKSYRNKTYGGTCRSPYVASFVPFGEVAGKWRLASRAIEFTSKYDPKSGTRAFTWKAKPGYRLCRAVIAPAGLPVHSTTATSPGRYDMVGINLDHPESGHNDRLLRYAFVTARRVSR